MSKFFLITAILAGGVFFSGCSATKEFLNPKPAEKTEKEKTEKHTEASDKSRIYSDLNETEQQYLDDIYNKNSSSRKKTSKQVFGL